MPSAAGPAAALGLKTRSALMAGDMDLTTTTAAGQAQNAAVQAQALAAAAAAPAGAQPAAHRAAAHSGAYPLAAMQVASQSLPAMSARSSSAGRAARLVAAMFKPSNRPAAQRPGAASAPTAKGRGRPPAEGGQFVSPRCNTGVKTKETLMNSHFKEYEITKADGSKEKQRLCVRKDAEVRSLLAIFTNSCLTFCSHCLGLDRLRSRGIGRLVRQN